MLTLLKFNKACFRKTVLESCRFLTDIIGLRCLIFSGFWYFISLFTVFSCFVSFMFVFSIISGVLFVAKEKNRINKNEEISAIVLSEKLIEKSLMHWIVGLAMILVAFIP